MEKIIGGVIISLIGVMIWYLKNQTNRQNKREDKHDVIQKELREFSQGLVKNELKLLHKDSLSTAKLTRKGLVMMGTLTEYLNLHFNGCADKVNFRKKGNKANGQKK